MREESKRSGRDRGKVAGGQNWEIKYMTQKYNVSAEEVKKAIEAVGNSRNKVEEYLKGKGK